MTRYIYFLINKYTGERIGRWYSYQDAEYARNMLDDWTEYEVMDKIETI